MHSSCSPHGIRSLRAQALDSDSAGLNAGFASYLTPLCLDVCICKMGIYCSHLPCRAWFPRTGPGCAEHFPRPEELAWMGLPLSLLSAQKSLFSEWQLSTELVCKVPGGPTGGLREAGRLGLCVDLSWELIGTICLHFAHPSVGCHKQLTSYVYKHPRSVVSLPTVSCSWRECWLCYHRLDSVSGITLVDCGSETFMATLWATAEL